MQKSKHSYIARRNIKWYSYFREQFGSFNVKYKLSIRCSNSNNHILTHNVKSRRNSIGEPICRAGIEMQIEGRRGDTMVKERAGQAGRLGSTHRHLLSC